MSVYCPNGLRRLLLLVVASFMAGASIGQDEARVAVATTQHFAFYSDFATNLNDALIVAGTARSRDEPELFRAEAEAPCFDALAPSARAGWNRAVDYYAEIISPAGWLARQQFLVRMDLASREEAREDARSESFVRIAKAFRDAASPAYEQCYWTQQDHENRQWIGDLMPRLEAHGVSIARRLEVSYQTPFHGLPILVDVVATAPPVGANSVVFSPAGGHVLVASSSGLTGNTALEIVFHEASHTLATTWRRDPLPLALEQAAKELDVPLPGDLWHVVLFYTTGQSLRRVLEAAGEPGFVPYIDAFDLWNGPWGRYRQAIEKNWPAYMGGERALLEAATDLLRDLGAPSDERR